MKVWIIDSEGYPEVIGLRTQRETAREAAEKWLDAEQAQYSGEGFTGWKVNQFNRECESLFYVTPYGKHHTISIYSMDVED